MAADGQTLLGTRASAITAVTKILPCLCTGETLDGSTISKSKTKISSAIMSGKVPDIAYHSVMQFKNNIGGEACDVKPHDYVA